MGRTAIPYIYIYTNIDNGTNSTFISFSNILNIIERTYICNPLFKIEFLELLLLFQQSLELMFVSPSKNSNFQTLNSEASFEKCCKHH